MFSYEDYKEIIINVQSTGNQAGYEEALKADKFVITAFVHVLMGIQIFFVCFFDWSFIVAFIKLHAGKLCGESGMSAVIRPVSV